MGKRINDLKEALTGKRMFTQLSGPEMFGFSHATIAKLIQEMPNANLCTTYVAPEYVPSHTGIPQAGKRNKAAKRKRVEEDEDEEEEEEEEEEAGQSDSASDAENEEVHICEFSPVIKH